MEYSTFAPSALADYEVPILDLARVDVVDLLIAVELTDPFRRAVVLDGHFSVGRSRFTYGQRRFFRTASYDSTFPARLLCDPLLRWSLLREHRRCRRGRKHRHEQ